MKIEKISENQIRCTLTKDDLQDRSIKISELAYGSDKAKSLFKDMMQQAAYEFGFEADDIPLMIEAVPLSADCIVLTVTKVEDPEELDTRFAKFAPAVHETEDSEEGYEDAELEPFARNPETFAHKSVSSQKARTSAASNDASLAKSGEAAKADKKEAPVCEISSLLFSFRSLDDVIALAGVIAEHFHEKSALYKHPGKGTYILQVERGSMDIPAFEKVYFTLSEYGLALKNANVAAANLSEHYEMIIAEQAIQKLTMMR